MALGFSSLQVLKDGAPVVLLEGMFKSQEYTRHYTGHRLNESELRKGARRDFCPFSPLPFPVFLEKMFALESWTIALRSCKASPHIRLDGQAKLLFSLMVSLSPRSSLYYPSDWLLSRDKIRQRQKLGRHGGGAWPVWLGSSASAMFSSSTSLEPSRETVRVWASFLLNRGR